MKILQFILFFSISSNILKAQDLSSEIKLTNYTTANGLPEENINSITEDNRGFIWLGSQEGLFRFDGKNYKTWYSNINDSNYFKSNSITVVGEYLPNKILFISAGQLWEINITNFKIRKAKSLSNKILTYAPLQLHQNNWIASTIDSIYILDKSFNISYVIEKTKYFNDNSSIKYLALQYPYVLLQSSDNKYISLNYVNNAASQVLINFPKIDARAPVLTASLYDSLTNKLYFNSFFNGIFEADFELPSNKTLNLVSIKGLNNDLLRQVFKIEKDLEIQIGENNFYLSNPKNKTIFNIKYNEGNDTERPIIQNIYKSKNNSYWLCTTQGISKFSFTNSNINTCKINSLLKTGDEFKKIIKAPDGNIYFLGSEKGIFQLNIKTNTVTSIKSDVSYYWDITNNGTEIEVVGGGKKHLLLNTLTHTIFYSNNLNKYLQPNNDLVTLCYKSKLGEMWYSSNVGGGLVRYSPILKKYFHYSSIGNNPTFSHRYLHTVAEDSKGNLYFGSNKNHQILIWNNELQKFDEYAISALITKFKHNTGINQLHCDSNDNLWIVLDGAALLKYNFYTKKGDYIDINRGLPTDKINGICNDNKNRIWISTNKGLCCYMSNTNKILIFNSNDGFFEDKFSEALYFDTLKNVMYVTGTKSIARFNTDSLINSISLTTLKVFIEDMLVNGKTFYFENEQNIKLQANENNVSFNFSVADFYRNNQIEFEYKINNNNWISIGEKRNVTFNNLNSEKYILTARCKYKGSEQWFETTKQLTFTIAIPWYKSWWFYTLVALTIIGFAWWLNRAYYLRKIEKQKAIVEKQNAIQAERNRIAADMHDDLGSGLTKITYLSQMALSSMDKEKNIQKINQTSAELVENMSEIIWAMKEENNNLSDLISHIKKYIIEYCTDNNLEYSLNFSNNFTEKNINGENRRHIFLVVKEILHNIVKHSNATKVIVTASYQSAIKLTISDNGSGFNINNQHSNSGNGLKNIRKRIQAVNGTIHYENNNGTSVSINIPI